MADVDNLNLEVEGAMADNLASLAQRKLEIEQTFSDPVAMASMVYQLWWNWADFHLYVISPFIDSIKPPILISPEQIKDSEVEFVYPIMDGGDHFATSKAGDMYHAGKSNCKLFYTIEKMIAMLVERLNAGGVDMQTEVQVAFGGHQLAQRKAFESIINLNYNVVVTNFDPGRWGEHYLEIVKVIADKGYGYPTETPRDNYKQEHGSSRSVRSR